jgi:hypothetical protein
MRFFCGLCQVRGSGVFVETGFALACLLGIRRGFFYVAEGSALLLLTVSLFRGVIARA